MSTPTEAAAPCSPRCAVLPRGHQHLAGCPECPPVAAAPRCEECGFRGKPIAGVCPFCGAGEPEIPTREGARDE